MVNVWMCAMYTLYSLCNRPIGYPEAPKKSISVESAIINNVCINRVCWILVELQRYSVCVCVLVRDKDTQTKLSRTSNKGVKRIIKNRETMNCIKQKRQRHWQRQTPTDKIASVVFIVVGLISSAKYGNNFKTSYIIIVLTEPVWKRNVWRSSSSIKYNKSILEMKNANTLLNVYIYTYSLP